MKILVLGANGATGRQVVRELINRNIHTRILIRKTAVLDQDIAGSSFVEIVKGNISELHSSEMNRLLHDCSVLISCLGHNPTFKGMFGKPHHLVSDAVKKVCEAVKKRPEHKVKLILMSTTGYTHLSEGETNSTGERMLFSLLSLLLPPHRDNVKAADYLLAELGKEDEHIRWIAVRPDTLVNEEKVSPYEVTSSPVRSPLFNAGKTSRRNVGHFMAELATDPLLWKRWEGKMPVIYNEQRSDR